MLHADFENSTWIVSWGFSKCPPTGQCLPKIPSGGRHGLRTVLVVYVVFQNSSRGTAKFIERHIGQHPQPSAAPIRPWGILKSSRISSFWSVCLVAFGARGYVEPRIE